VVKFIRNGVPPPVSGVPPPEVAVPTPFAGNHWNWMANFKAKCTKY